MKGHAKRGRGLESLQGATEGGEELPLLQHQRVSGIRGAVQEGVLHATLTAISCRYIQRRTKEDFRRLRSVSDPVLLEKALAKGKDDLEVAKRQSLVYKMYARKLPNVLVSPGGLTVSPPICMWPASRRCRGPPRNWPACCIRQVR